MLLRQLKYLAALARERHFVRAAQACNVTQPTLSAGIKQLEEELGLLLVRRGRRFEGFTVEGEQILAWASRVEADTASLLQEAAALRGGLHGRLRLGVIPVVLPVVPLITALFAERHPGVILTVLSQPSVEIQRGLDDFSLDAGLTYLDNEPLSHVRTIPLYHERYLLFTPAGGSLSELEEVSWRDAATLPLCLMTPDMQNRRILDATFHALGTIPRPVLETNSVLTISALLRTGKWSSILPQTFVKIVGPVPGLRIIPLVQPVLRHGIGLVLPDREPLSPMARGLAELMGGAEVVRAFAMLEAGDGR